MDGPHPHATRLAPRSAPWQGWHGVEAFAPVSAARATLSLGAVLGASLIAPQVYARLTALGALHPAATGGFRPADAALVLGARVWEDGRPSLFLRQRVEAGVALYERGVVARLVMTGAGHNREGLDETEAMVRTALEPRRACRRYRP
ncbi:hypothetical protein GCM10025876_09880 [Demequina litorisediminis]|uniref:Uncharacterized protein n=1 Tax=Demequina litorisediminis TaxID=1849022 RepID=A0ABQ6IDI2_9MICO|nr:hypothetical protein GCM10025876_09880 [Demequina litorisediminis]